MKAMIAAAMLSLGLLPASAPAAAGKATPAEAVAMVQRAKALIQSAGRERAFAAIADPANRDFHDRDLYIFVYSLNGVALTHGNNPKMVGRQLITMKDNEGKLIIKEMTAIAKNHGRGWLDYKWPNPVTKEVESKAAYVEKLDDMLIGSGIYR
ncbi:cache domain-containing protein [Duganella callida]|uniref:Histidine kinase n=1 Tax=Duganella callida TaxID=2561932 RepID=A0A4Y9SAZ5_9BURK|nr:cache domain-containing protein [Duganella callida]TFW19100.1 histidine kinase [Duganella callida]